MLGCSHKDHRKRLKLLLSIFKSSAGHLLTLSEDKSQLQKEPQRPMGASPDWKALFKPTGQARHYSKPGLAVGRSQQQIACAWAGADHSTSRSVSREQSSSHPHTPRVHSKGSKSCSSWAALQGSCGWRLRVTILR